MSAVEAGEPTTSEEWFARGLAVLPGGVDSPVRAYGAVGGTPRVMARGVGAELEDVEGRRTVDFVGSFGPLILGHAHPEVTEAVQEAVRRGTTYGAPCRAEALLAEKVVASYPGLEQVRFVSSGTEATMSAIRLARGATGRDLVVKFTGCYHGHADHLLVAAGSGLKTFGQPSSAGVPAAFAELTRVLPLDDEQRLADLFAREGDRIAAVIIEPVPGNNGLLLQRREYLQTLRELTVQHGALLIFDEVMSGFRVARGGAAERYGIVPDLATFGKVIGGGLPVGAFGGRRELTRHLAPEGAVYQAGTLSGNPVAMAAGQATLEVLEREAGYQRLEQIGQRLEALLRPVLAAAAEPAQLVRCGSKFWICLQGGDAPAQRRGRGRCCRRPLPDVVPRPAGTRHPAGAVGVRGRLPLDRSRRRAPRTLCRGPGRGAEGMKLRPPSRTRSIQVGFLALFLVCIAQSAYWILDEVRYTSDIRDSQRASHERDCQAAQRLLDGGTAPTEVFALFPHLEGTQDGVRLRPAVALALDQARHSRLNRYGWEGSFFLAVLAAGMVVLSRSLLQHYRLRMNQENFLAAVSHELKSPLAAIRLSGETLQLRDPDQPRRTRILERMLQDVDRLQDMIQNILGARRLDEGIAAGRAEHIVLRFPS